MMARALMICFLSLLFSPSFATNELTPGNARTAGLGNASVMLSDPFSAYYNQAGLGFVNEFTVGVTAEQKFMLEDLNTFTGTATIPTETGTFGLSLNYFGGGAYNEIKAGLGFGKRFGKFSAGLQFDFLGFDIDGYGNKNSFTFEAGIQYRITQDLHLGAHVFNPVRITMEDFSDEKVPTLMRFGFSYNPIDQVTIVLETEKDIERDAGFKVGMEYAIIEELDLRVGMNTEPLETSFGFGLNLQRLNIDMAARYHADLGFSPQVSLIYAFPKKKDQPDPK